MQNVEFLSTQCHNIPKLLYYFEFNKFMFIYLDSIEKQDDRYVIGNPSTVQWTFHLFGSLVLEL